MSTEDRGREGDADTAGRCATHPDLDAVGTCDRCGSFMCNTCCTYYDYVPVCPTCRERRTHDSPSSPRARLALILAILAAFFMVIPFGFPAVFLAHSELQAIDAGEAPPGGRGYARAAVLVGWCANLVFAIGVVAFAALVAVIVYAES